jgi:hypothetical protein
MSGISPVQAVSPAETWEAWQALLQAGAGEMAGAEAAPQPGLETGVHAAADVATAMATTMPTATEPAGRAFMHASAPANAVPAQAAADAAPPPTQPPAPSLLRSHEAAPGASAPLQPPSPGLPADLPVRAPQLADAGAAVLPMAPVLMTPLALQNGPELRWRVQDAPAWRTLFDDAGQHAQQPQDEDDAPAQHAAPAPDDAAHAPPPPWAQALLARLREAAAAPASAERLRPALQAWRVGLPVLLASPAGLASLQASRDASVWHARRWPARWRSARPAAAERWWAVRLGLGPEGRPRTLRELAGSAGSPGPGPGQVSCELRLDDAAPGLARWTEVLVQAAPQPSLRALLAQRPSMPWLLCNQGLWPQEAP